MAKLTRDFVVRPPRRSDAARITELVGDWEVVRWLAVVPHPYTLADAEEWLGRLIPAIEAGTVRGTAIEVDCAFAGVCTIEPGKRGPFIGYWLGRPYWGRGIMTAVAAEFVAAHFADPSSPDLHSGYFTGNEGSAAIQRRLRFVVTGEGERMNRPHARRLPHIETVLTRMNYRAVSGAPPM